MKKLFATDLDGTLLNSDKVVSDATKKAVYKMIDRGYDIVAVSGRVSSSTRYVMDKIGLRPYVIANNGAIILDPNGDIIYEIPFKHDLLEKIIEIGNKYNINIQMYSKDTFFGKTFNTVQFSHLMNEDGPLKTKFYFDENYSKYVIDNDITVYKMFIYESVEENMDLFNELSEIEEIEVTASGEYCIDIMMKNVSKGKALEILAKKLGYERENIVAIGDYDNDISMIKFAGIGIAMGDGSESAKNSADYVADTNGNNGFSKIIDKLINEGIC